jgi:hypothetical protein
VCGRAVVIAQFPSPQGCAYCDLHAREAFEQRQLAAGSDGVDD